MDYFDIGVRFSSYDDLRYHLKKYFTETKTFFWKRDTRPINAIRGSILSFNESLVYYEIKYACIYSGCNKARKRKRSDIEKTGCPAYLRFKTSDDGKFLQLVAMNTKHNHEQKLAMLSDSSSYSEESSDIEYIQVVLENTVEEDSNTVSEIADNKFSNMVNFEFRGLIAPVFTPFKDDNSIDESVIPKYVEFLIENGIKGILVNGTSGEGMSLNVAERKKLTELWMQEASKKLHVMVQVGGACLPDVIELAKHAESVGVHSILCLPDLYMKPTCIEDLVSYLKVVSEAAPSTPLLYYHIPMFTNVKIHMGKFLREGAPLIPTFKGIKFTSTLLDEGIDAVEVHDKKYAVFLGADTLMLAACIAGFDSAIATTFNIYPKLGQNIFDNYRNNNIKEAQDSQKKLNKIVSIITKYGGWVPTMKAAMNLQNQINVGPVRKPMKQLTENEITDLELELKPAVLL